MKLFNYQVDVINGVYRKIKEGKRKIAVVAPTGSGKTVMMGQICKDATDRGRKVLILVHLDVLVPQTRDKLIAFGLEARLGYIKAGYPENSQALIQIASIQTLARRKWWKELTFNLVIYDECHLTMFSKVGQDIRYRVCPDSLVLGFTATPYRLNKRQGLADHFEDLVAAPTPKQLQDMGKLSKLRYFSIGEPDLANVRTLAGDFNEADLAIACETPELILKVVEEYKRLVNGKTAIVSCVDVKHAQAIAKAFNEDGIPAATVTGETPIKERKKLYEALDRGELLVLTFVMVVAIGFDLPSVVVLIKCRPSKSLALVHQVIGRVMRTSPGKECGYVLDQSGNIKRHGFPEDIQGYELTEGCKGKPGEAPVKECPECDALINTFLMTCPECGYVFPAKERLKDIGRLVEVKPDSKEDPRTFYRKKLKEAYKKGYSPGWAFVQYQKVKGKDVFPGESWALGAIFDGDESKMGEYYNHLCSVKERSNKPDTWVLNQLGKEFGMSQAVIFIQRTTGGIYAQR